ncbi:MAG: DUF4249 family protein [Saprospiraceae bacterium]
MKKIAFILYSIFGMLLFTLAGCLDEIELETPAANQESLVIQGKLIVGDPAHVEVKVSKLFTFTADGKQPVNARKVVLIDEDQREIELEDRGLGNYSIDIPANYPSFSIDLEKPYYIRVETFDGRTFESAPEQGLPVPKIAAVNYQLVTREVIDLLGKPVDVDFVRYSVDTPLSTDAAGRNIRLGWEYFHTFKVRDTPISSNTTPKTCYITQNLNIAEIRVVDASVLTADTLRDYEIYETNFMRVFGEGLYFTTVQESLTETAYEFFTQVAENTGRTGSMFEAPPGKVVSNIRNINDENDEAFGFFYVTEQDTLRTYVDTLLIGDPSHFCPPPGGLTREDGSCREPICCNCLSVPQSTIFKPGYWTH